MLYLTIGENKLPAISADIAAILVLIDQITKNRYTYPLTLEDGWYVFELPGALPVSQFDGYVQDAQGEDIYTLVAQYGDFERKKTEYTQDLKITAYNG